MKPFLYVLTLVSLQILVGCSDSGIATEGFEIKPGVGVGPITLGMKMDEVENYLGKPDRASRRAWEYLNEGMAIVPNRAGDAVGGILMGDTKGGKLARAFKGKTREGIGMGSTKSEILAAFGKPDNTERQAGVEALTYDSGRSRSVYTFNRAFRSVFRTDAPTRFRDVALREYRRTDLRSSPSILGHPTTTPC